jgi:hypothetical protein
MSLRQTRWIAAGTACFKFLMEELFSEGQTTRAMPFFQAGLV